MQKSWQIKRTNFFLFPSVLWTFSHIFEKIIKEMELILPKFGVFYEWVNLKIRKQILFLISANPVYMVTCV